MNSFKLDQGFLAKYKNLAQNFGFNGLGEIVYKRSYSRLRPDNSYETWHQTVQRVVEGTFSLMGTHSPAGLPNSSQEAMKMYEKMFHMKFLPPGRGLWGMGTQISRIPSLYAALNNCGFVSTGQLALDSLSRPFTFLYNASMLGIGVGFDTKGSGLIRIHLPNDTFYHKITDTREGWGESLELLLNSFFYENVPKPLFDYSGIRPAGTVLRTFGGLSTGAEPLKNLHKEVSELLSRRAKATLGSRDIVDLMNVLGKSVVSGSNRRAAEVALGEATDQQFLSLKNYEKHPERAEFGWVSNNTVLADRGMDYSQIAQNINLNGEPGVVWLENMQTFGRMGDPADFKDRKALGGPPCLEQTLESYELCCLVEVFINAHDNLEEFLDTLKSAFLYAKTVTLAVPHWEGTSSVMTRNRRIGTSLTGITQFIACKGMGTLQKWCTTGYDTLKAYDSLVAELFGVPNSIKITAVKPSGTVSLLAGATPGLHFPFAHYYIRRVRLSETDIDLLNLLELRGYPLEDDLANPRTKVVSIPVQIDRKVKVLREVSMWEQLELAAFMQKHWADNQISCTVTFDKETEGKSVNEALQYCEKHLKSVSFLPQSRAQAYAQMPYEEITEEAYYELNSKLKNIPESTVFSVQEKALYPDTFCDSCSLDL